MQRKILPAICGLSAALWGMSWVGQADDKNSADAPRPIPAGPLGDAIRLGRELVENTTSHRLSKPFVGNALNCTSCHLKNGADFKAASFAGVAAAYPAWSPREQRVITLEDRILNCFMRSCNGIRPPLGSQVSVSITAYITWLSSDQPIRMNATRPAGPNAVAPLEIDAGQADHARGQVLYEKRCATCHGRDGQGDEDNPPLWGDLSYNDGAGLANVKQLASWLKIAMPLGDADLTEQESLDLADYVNQHSRPRFILSDHLPDKDRLGEFNTENTSRLSTSDDTVQRFEYR